MTKARRNRRKKSPDGRRNAALALLVLIIMVVGAYLIARPRTQATPPAQFPPPITVSPRLEPRKPTQAITSSASQENQKTEEQDKEPASVTPAPHLVSPGARKAKLSIIIDDMGNSMQEARSLAAIGVPLTFAIIPGLAHVREVAAFAASRNIETMIHLPMQSKGWPQRRLEPNGLLVSMDDQAIASRMDEFFRLVPGASGANNHMGSEFTEHEEKMRPVLTALKQKGFFFIDSVTTPHSVGYRMAREMGIRSARRNVFLDNEQNRDYINGQLRQAVAMASKHGSAIAICHPHPATISALAAFLPTLKQQGVTLAPASSLSGE